jgi:hypothetical protein
MGNNLSIREATPDISLAMKGRSLQFMSAQHCQFSSTLAALRRVHCGAVRGRKYPINHTVAYLDASS